MKKSILFGIFIVCLLMLLIPSSSAIEIQLIDETDEMKLNNSNINSIKLILKKEKVDERKSTYVNLPPDGNKEYYAIIAGCTEYEESRHSLPNPWKPFPESTMKHVYNILVNSPNWDEENIVLLLNKKATKQNIIKAFTEMGNIIDGDDIFLFSWNGHGTKVLDSDGDDNDGYDEAICPYDTKTKNLELINILTDDEIDSLFSKIGAEGLFIMFECCMSGGLVDEEAQLNYSFVDVNDDRRVVVMSTPSDKLGFGTINLPWPILLLYSIAFSEISCDIDNNGWISAEEAFMYVDVTYPLLENELHLELINISISLSVLINFLLMNKILKILRLKLGVRVILSTIFAYITYKIYQKDEMKQLLIEYIKILNEINGIENNPNICDNYFGELNIIKIE